MLDSDDRSRRVRRNHVHIRRVRRRTPARAPWAHRHDGLRGACVAAAAGGDAFTGVSSILVCGMRGIVTFRARRPTRTGTAWQTRAG